MAAVVVAVDKDGDGVDEVADGVEAAAADSLAGDDAEKISTMCSQDPLAGVKCRVIRGFRVMHHCPTDTPNTKVRSRPEDGSVTHHLKPVCHQSIGVRHTRPRVARQDFSLVKSGRHDPDAPPLHPAMRSLPLRSASAPDGWRAT